MKISKYNRAYVCCAMIASVGLMLCATREGWAQDKFKYSFKAPPGVSKYTQQHVIDVGDVPGHQIRIYELHSKFGEDAPAYDGVKVVEAWGRQFSDYTNGSGNSWGYSTSMLANGDKIFARIELISQTSVAQDGARTTKFTSVSRLTGGTGKFKGIRGTLTGTGFTDLKSGTSGAVTEGEYWFEK